MHFVKEETNKQNIPTNANSILFRIFSTLDACRSAKINARLKTDVKRSAHQNVIENECVQWCLR